jgi:hypothetical protein
MAQSCMGPLVRCSEDCLCAEALNGFYQCVAGDGNALGCGTMFATVTPAAQALAQCAAGACPMQCGL